jgi:DNA processing protein
VEGGGVKAACDDCLRRGALIGLVARRIADLLNRPRVPVVHSLLALPDEQLLDAVAGNQRARIEAAYRRFRASTARAAIAEARCEAVCVHCDDYPKRLTHLTDPPRPLYLRGGIERLARLSEEPGVAIVGGRQASRYALDVAEEMGRGLAAAGATVISGLALGVDAASHRGAMAGGDGAIAVLARGPDACYPTQHRSLYEQIVERGVVVSEIEPGIRPFRWSFPARNRIMAALARVVVVVEAREQSGSLITAAFAEDLGRELGAVPGLVTARAAAGTNGLLRDGATLVRDAEDVLDMLYGVGVRPRKPRPTPALEPRLRVVLDAVEVHDDLQLAARRVGLSAGGLRAALGRLEALGLVKSDGLGGYMRCVAPGVGS